MDGIGCGLCIDLVGYAGMDWLAGVYCDTCHWFYCSLFCQQVMKQWRVTYKFKGPSEWQLGYMAIFAYDSQHAREKFPMWPGLIVKIEEI
jgi:hypothetical protein